MKTLTIVENLEKNTRESQRATTWLFSLGVAAVMGGVMAMGCGLSDSGLGNNVPDAASGSGGGPVGTGGGSGGAASGSGGGSASGGRSGTGGNVVGSGGSATSGGSSGTSGTGGRASEGGATGSGGSAAGGTGGSGGSVASGGATASGGTVGTGGLDGGTAGRSGTGGRGSGGRSGAGGTGGASTCNLTCATGRVCCGGACVNTDNDPYNCGMCGHTCTGATTYCSSGTCEEPPCSGGGNGMGMGMGGGGRQCSNGGTCCGSTCCPEGDLCCASDGPVSGSASCHHPTASEPTCPAGCSPLCVSDRDAKMNIAPLDAGQASAILAKVTRLPIATWTYRSEAAGIRHVGPMAQDFYESFRLGDSDRSYHSVDGHGVALAAIQALDRLVQAERERVQALEKQNRALVKRIELLESATGRRGNPMGRAGR